MLCEYCHDRRAVIDGRWCSAAHRRNAQRDASRADPSPAEIRKLCAEIRSTWPPERWREYAPDFWTLPLIDDSEIVEECRERISGY